MMEHVWAAREQLVQLYATPLPVEEKRHRKTLIFASLDEALQGIGLRRVASQANTVGAAERTLNNAYMVALGTYYALLPAFEGLLNAQRGDLNAFYRAAAKLGQMSKGERHQRLHTIALERYDRNQGTSEPVGTKM
jgi:predicted aminopeptidase